MKTSIYHCFFAIFSLGWFPVFAQQKESTHFEKYTNVPKPTKQQKEAASQALLQARKYIVNHQWDEAITSYKLALKYDSSNLNNYLELAYYYKDRRDYRNALSLSEKLLPFYKKQTANDPSMKRGAAIILEIMGESLLSRGDTIEAKKKFLEAVEMMDQLAEKNQKVFLLDLAVAYKKLGIYYTKINDFENARTCLHTSLNDAVKSASWNIISSGCEITAINIYLGNCYFKNNDFLTAKDFYEKALQKKDTNSIDCYSPYPDNIALAKRGLAKTYLQLKDSLKAERFYKEVIEFYENSFSKNREHYIDIITTSLEELMQFYNYKISETNFSWNEKLFRYNLMYYKIYRLEEDYKSDIAELYNDFGNACMKIDEFKRADSIYKEALQLYRKRSQFEEDYKTKLVIVLNNLGLVHENLKDYSHSESYRLEALKLCESVYKDSTNAMDADICLYTQRDLISLYLLMMGQLKSDSLFKKFKVITESLYEQMQNKCTVINNNSFWEPCSPGICGSLSYSLLFLKKFQEAAKAAQWGLERDSSQIWIKTNLAHALLFQGAYKDAENLYQELKTLHDSDGNSFKEAILKDFDELEKYGVSSGEVIKIKKLLEK